MNKVVNGGESAVLVHIDFRDSQFNEEFDEFIQLATSTNLNVHTTITGSRDVPSAKYFVGQGKVDEIKARVSEFKTSVVIFNHPLSPAQERNLERELSCRVLDRVGLILDIFAQRARSHEGKLQVELAQLQHLSTRLVRGWSHLERQKGGIGLRGPGETQLETDRRLLGNRIKTINSRLEKVKRQREQGRRLRKRTATPVISLVGYTNAGKSTLFNKLTHAKTYVADKLFATLDTTLRRVELTSGNPVILSDTVGFIRNIPHDVIDAFHATLKEVREADLLLHIVDANDEQRYSRIKQVDAVIEEIRADTVPQILVFNKIDQNQEMSARIERHDGSIPKVWLSARTGEGVSELLQLIHDFLMPSQQPYVLRLPSTASQLRARLFQSGQVDKESIDESGGWIMHIKIDPNALTRLCHDHGIDKTMIE